MAGTFDPQNLPKKPGLYINFVQAAQSNIIGGERGIVAIPLKETTGTAVKGKVYEVYNELEAIELFGADNIQSVKFALAAGARKVIVYTMPEEDLANGLDEATIYSQARTAFEARPFNVFVYDGEVDDVQKDAALTWVQRNRDEGKHFFVVIGGDDASDLDPQLGDDRTALYADDYVINVITGVEIAGVSYNSSEYAPYIAGLVVQVALNKSLTYHVLPVEEVSVRMTNQQINASLTAGSFFFLHDGEKVKICQGLVSTGKKVRSVKTRQTVATDITLTGEENYIGKISNTPDGQAALVSAVKAYLENLEDNDVLRDIKAEVDKSKDNSKDAVHLNVSYVDVDSVERIFLNINI